MEPTHVSWHSHLQTFLTRLARQTKASMLLSGIGILLVLVIIFQLGILVGIRKARYQQEIRVHYPVTEQLPVAHGATGTIISITPPLFVVADEDHTEKVILVKDETIIRSPRHELTINELLPRDYVVVIGTPNTQGQIQANFIRVTPSDPVR
jgi:hypothetical protein